MKKIFFVALSSVLLMGCAVISLTPNGAQVKLIDHHQPSKACHYVGPVSASDSGWNIEDSVISNKTLIEDSLNELRNAAAKPNLVNENSKTQMWQGFKAGEIRRLVTTCF
ncbi:MAG: DUF4156 domain-containing protein [Proteobacteria bacterium]|nr:DUF4156 domain-containing protein [Pseudomonadota bacterium]